MKTIEIHWKIMKIKKIQEIHERITEIMKIQESNERIAKPMLINKLMRIKEIHVRSITKN